MAALNTITIPDDLVWRDEWNWTPYAEQATQSLNGSLIVERSPQATGGRPITLEGDDDRAWVERTTLDSLRALLSETTMTLDLWDGRSFTVGWRHGDGPIEAQEYIGTGFFHSLVLRLREV